VKIVAIVDPRSDDTQFVGVDVVRSYADMKKEFDAVIVTDVTRAKLSFDAAVEACGAERVLAPASWACGRRQRRRRARHE